MNKNKQNYKKIFISAGIFFVLIVSWKLYQKIFPKEVPGTGRNSAVAVEIAPIRTGSLRDIGQYTATLEAKSRVIVAPKVSGRLNRLLVNIGDSVKSGQTLALLEDEEYRQKLIQAEADLNVAVANLKQAESALEIAQKNLERARTLHQSGIQSDAQLDQVLAQYQSQQAQYNVALAQLENRRAALENARLQLSYTEIKAFWSTPFQVRYVGERFADQGALLAVNTPILSLIELNPIVAVIFVTDQEYFRLKVNQPVMINSNAFSNKQFKGKVVRIAPLLQESSRQARIEIEVENDELLLKPGMFVNAAIQFASKNNIRIIPLSALTRRNDQTGIFIADPEKRVAHFVPVETGISENQLIEIVKPADLSGYVVVLGHHLLEAEGRINLPESFLSKAKEQKK